MMISRQDKIKHLYARAGFGLSPDEWAVRKNWSVQEAVDALFRDAENERGFSTKTKLIELNNEEISAMSKEKKKELNKEMKQLIIKQNSEWVHRMGDPAHSDLLEKMSLFWHGHFACITRNSKLAFRQTSTIRRHALGNFRDFVLAMAKDVSMIRFLNNQQNRKRKPNENFARELLELFTIGRGNYTEADVKAAARAFTGWSSDLSGEFVFRKRQHDYGSKTFMGKTGDFDGGDIIQIVLDRKETAAFITRKIYRFFINEDVNERYLRRLTQIFYESDYDIKHLMRTIFEDKEFYHKSNVGVKIKSPVELMAGIMRTLKVDFKATLTLVFLEKALGQVLFNPPNVAGWAGGKSWIDNSTLMLRLNLVNYLYYATEVNFKIKDDLKSRKPNKAIRKIKATVDLKPLIKVFSTYSQEEVFDHLVDYLLPIAPKQAKKLFDAFSIRENQEDYIKSLTMRLMSLPEYQLC